MRTRSCDPDRLYAGGGLYEELPGSPEDAGRGLGRWLANVYPPYAYARTAPAHIGSRDPATDARVREYFAGLDARYPRGASTDLFVFENAVVYDRSLYIIVPPGEIVQLFETNREIDRAWKIDLDPALLEQARRPRSGDVHYLYLGSAGSDNYGHWLVDDLTRAKAFVDAIPATEHLAVVLQAHAPAIDAIRLESLHAVIGREREIDIIVIDKTIPHFFDRLWYVSPNSYTPLLKSPAGIDFLRSRLLPATARAPRAPERLFIGRQARWRNLLNAGAVADFFSERGFTCVSIDPGSCSFAEQVALFAQAKIVVGVAGASMVNTMFAPATARLFYLAPEGFVDPWYWDLAAVNGQSYSVCYGTPWKPEAPNFSSFRIEPDQLRELESWISA